MKPLFALFFIGVSCFLYACAWWRIDGAQAQKHKDRGDVYLQGGKLDKAIEAYQKAIRLNPTFVEAYYHLADAYSLKNEKTLSRESLQKAMKLEGSYIMDAWPERWRKTSLPDWDRNIPMDSDR
jgi:tetratricopeptide (TPR) repeat protein